MDRDYYHLDAALTSFAIMYRTEGFVADIVCPRVPVAEPAGKFHVFGTENLKRHDTSRARKSGPNISSISASQSTFVCQGHSMADRVDDDDRRVAKGWDPDMLATQVNLDKLMIDLEYEVATLLTTAANYGTGFSETLAAGNKIDSDGSPLDLEAKIDSAKTTVKGGCGFAPNSILVPYEVGLAIKRHGQIQEQRKYTNDLTRSGIPTSLWGLNVIEAGAIRDTAREGQTKSLSAIWGDHIVIFYLNPAVNFMGMAFAKNFTYDLDSAFQVYRIPEPTKPNNCVLIDVREGGRDPQICCNTAGYVIRDTLE